MNKNPDITSALALVYTPVQCAIFNGTINQLKTKTLFYKVTKMRFNVLKSRFIPKLINRDKLELRTLEF